MLEAKNANKIIITRTFATGEKHNEDDMYFWTEANGAEIEICHSKKCDWRSDLEMMRRS